MSRRSLAVAGASAAAAAAAAAWWYTDSAPYPYAQRKILDLPELRVSATCVRVPVLNSHSEAVWVRTREPISPGNR